MLIPLFLLGPHKIVKPKITYEKKVFEGIMFKCSDDPNEEVCSEFLLILTISLSISLWSAQFFSIIECRAQQVSQGLYLKSGSFKCQSSEVPYSLWQEITCGSLHTGCHSQLLCWWKSSHGKGKESCGSEACPRRKRDHCYYWWVVSKRYNIKTFTAYKWQA